MWKEEFKYDEKGRRISIKKVPGPNYTVQDRLTWTWHYDDDGDIDEHGSSNGFQKEYVYDKTKLASETFMILEATEAEWALQGPLNCTLFKELPMEKFFLHAPVGETTDESEITYEPTGTASSINDIKTTVKPLQTYVVGNQLMINIPANLVGKTLQIFSATGACMRTIAANGSQATLNIENFAPGMYVVKNCQSVCEVHQTINKCLLIDLILKKRNINLMLKIANEKGSSSYSLLPFLLF